MRTAKFCATICALGFAIMVVGTHETQQLFPWVHGFVLLSATTLLAGVFSGRLSPRAVLSGSVVVAVSLRLFIFEWPASMIGMDPDKYAVGVLQVVQTGVLTDLKRELATYGVLSIFHTLNATVAVVGGLGGRNVLVAIPILTGVLFPLTAATLAARHDHSALAVGVAAVLAAIAAIGVLFGYWPIVQTAAVLLWCPAVISLSRWLSGGHQRDAAYFTTLFVLGVALVFSHKLSMFVPAGAIVAALLIRYARVDVLVLPDHQPATDGGYPRDQRGWIVALLLLLGLAIQWTMVTDFARAVALSILVPLVSGGLSIAPDGGVALAAVQANPGIEGILARRGDFITLLGVTALTASGLWFRDRSWPACILLGATLMPALVVAISVAGDGVAPQRAVLFGIPMFAAVIGIAAAHFTDGRRGTRALAVFVVVLFVVASQSGSAALAPNYPDDPRKYLTAGEVSAKTFMTDYTKEPVSMQFFYAREQVDLNAPGAVQKPGSAEIAATTELNDELLNATLTDSHDTILLQEYNGAKRFSDGRYRLTWNPIQTLSKNRSYGRMLDNGHAVGFSANRSYSDTSSR